MKIYLSKSNAADPLLVRDVTAVFKGLQERYVFEIVEFKGGTWTDHDNRRLCEADALIIIPPEKDLCGATERNVGKGQHTMVETYCKFNGSVNVFVMDALPTMMFGAFGTKIVTRSANFIDNYGIIALSYKDQEIEEYLKKRAQAKPIPKTSAHLGMDFDVDTALLAKNHYEVKPPMHNYESLVLKGSSYGGSFGIDKSVPLLATVLFL